jgi:RNA polymerase sigma factor (sigma-70 family)
MAKNESLKELGIEFKETRSERVFTDLYHRLKPGLTNYVFQIVKDYDISNHIISSVMSEVYNKIDKYDPKWHISTWIYRIAYTHACGYLRAKKSQRTVSLSAFENDENRNRLHKLEFDSIEDHRDAIEKREDADAEKAHINYIRSIVDNLPIEYREVVVEKFYNDLKYGEISAKLNIPLHTVKNRISRGKRIIQEELSKK